MEKIPKEHFKIVCVDIALLTLVFLFICYLSLVLGVPSSDVQG